jgi:hypothetical protein
MNVNYTDSVKDWREGFPLAQQATKRLEEVLGQSAKLVSAEWDRTEDEKGRALFLLRLKDFTGEVSRKLAPDDLRSSARTSFRMHQLWGNLLQVRNQRLLDDLTGTEG